MSIGMGSDIRRRAHVKRSPLTFIRENWRAIGFYLLASGGLIYGLTQATEATLTVLTFIAQLLFGMMFLIVQFGALFYLLGRGRTYWVQPGETGVYFSDHRGNDHVLEAARRTVTLLQGVREFKAMGGETVRGLLLEGPPGTGKSYLAQVMASEADLPFGYLSAPSLQAMFMGIGPLRVRMLYGKARKLARRHGGCILFIDEIDAIGMSRTNQMAGGGGMGMMGGGGSGLLNELLLQMDPPNFDNGLFSRISRGIGLKKGRAIPPPVLTVGATNIASVLDQALLRPGRFDRRIHVDKPDYEGRKDIIEYYLAKVRHEDMPVDRMGNDTIEYTPVAIKYVLNEAVIHAHFDGRDAISYADFSRARENHEWGLREPIRGLSQEDRRRLAYHEAGHAVAQVKLLPWDRLAKVTIIRHGSALGLSAVKPVEEKRIRVREEVLADIQVSLASRAAEELFLGSATDGVGSDFQKATETTFAMLNWWGMDGSFYSTQAFGMGASATTPDVRRRIDQILDQEYRKVKALLTSYSGAMHDLAQLLLDQDEVDGQDVEDLVTQYAEMIANGEEPKALPEPAAPFNTSVPEATPYVFGDGKASSGTNGRNGSAPEDETQVGNRTAD